MLKFSAVVAKTSPNPVLWEPNGCTRFTIKTLPLTNNSPLFAKYLSNNKKRFIETLRITPSTIDYLQESDLSKPADLWEHQNGYISVNFWGCVLIFGVAVVRRVMHSTYWALTDLVYGDIIYKFAKLLFVKPFLFNLFSYLLSDSLKWKWPTRTKCGSITTGRTAMSLRM